MIHVVRFKNVIVVKPFLQLNQKLWMTLGFCTARQSRTPMIQFTLPNVVCRSYKFSLEERMHKFV